MNQLEKNANEFLQDTMDFFKLANEERPISMDCSEQMEWLIDKLFICRFLHDCIDKGIIYHKTILDKNSEIIAQKIDPEEACKIPIQFKELIKNKDLISILAYEFYINYLDCIIRSVLHKNLNLLKALKKVNYESYELIDRITKDPNIILEELINLMISGYREEGNLRTKSEFWIKLLEEPIKLKLDEKEKCFWESFNIRRNASSHRNAKARWNDMLTNLSNPDLILWLYGLILLAYKIDCELDKTYDLKRKKIEINFSGFPIYDLKDLKI